MVSTRPHMPQHTAYSILGPIFQLSVIGTRILVLNDAKAAEDLLVKRGTIYAGKSSNHPSPADLIGPYIDRPHLHMAGEV